MHATLGLDDALIAGLMKVTKTKTEALHATHSIWSVFIRSSVLMASESCPLVPSVGRPASVTPDQPR